ncbi:unnamed protein product [Calypogeia fissa]
MDRGSKNPSREGQRSHVASERLPFLCFVAIQDNDASLSVSRLPPWLKASQLLQMCGGIASWPGLTKKAVMKATPGLLEQICTSSRALCWAPKAERHFSRSAPFCPYIM